VSVPQRRPLLEWTALIALSILLVGSLWTIPYLPTNDAPESVLTVHMEQHYSDPGSIYADAYEPSLQFAGRGFTILQAPLQAALGWQQGLHVALAVMALLGAWGFVWFVREVHPGRSALGFLGFPLALTWEFYMGFFAFVVGSGIGLFVLGLTVRWRRLDGARRAVLAGLLLLQAIAHVFSAALTGMIVALVLVTRAPRGARLAELGRVALMGAPAVGILLAANSRAGYIRSLVPGVFFVPLGRLARTLPRIVAPGPAARALVIAAVVAILLVASLVALVGRATETTSRSLALAAVLFALAGAFLPLHIPGWQYFSTRFVPLAVLLAIAVVPLERLASPSGVRWSSIAIFVCSAAWLVTSYPFHRRLADTATAALRGLEAPVTRHEVWLPFILDPFNGLAMDPTASEVPYLAPLLHIGALYATVHGGIIPFTFASSPATCPFQVRPLGLPARPLPDPTLVWNVIDSDPFHKDPVFRHGFEDDLANYAMYYEGVLLVGAEPSDIAHWKARGFLSEWQGDSVFLGHFEPCAVDVVTTPGRPPPRLDIGVQAQTLLKDLERPAVVGPDGFAHQRVDWAPCGHVWVRPHWDAQRSDGSASSTFCENAEVTGEVRVFIDKNRNTVRCIGGAETLPKP